MTEAEQRLWSRDFQTLGLSVLRFDNRQVLLQTDNVVECIVRAIDS